MEEKRASFNCEKWAKAKPSIKVEKQIVFV